MAQSSTSEEKRRALAVRLRELRTGGVQNRPLNRKELGMLLGEAMQRPAGAYAARRVGDFENPQAKSPPPVDALRAYAQVFTGDEPADPLEQELLELRDGIDVTPAQPSPDDPAPARSRRRVALAGVLAVLAVAVALGVALATRSNAPPAPVFCERNTESRPVVGDVAVVCARDVMLRPSPGAPAAQAIGTMMSGDRFTVDRYSSTGAWVHGTAHMKDGAEAEGWMEAGWFCPTAGADSPATACAAGESR